MIAYTSWHWIAATVAILCGVAVLVFIVWMAVEIRRAPTLNEPSDWYRDREVH
ncbi:MAG: hypothetical protein K0Q89_54 [Thermomicrobiales bacterium]|nr:hypothetical protein [Thermomicrobiales bacterium]